jgi:hypothetical protein
LSNGYATDFSAFSRREGQNFSRLKISPRKLGKSANLTSATGSMRRLAHQGLDPRLLKREPVADRFTYQVA